VHAVKQPSAAPGVPLLDLKAQYHSYADKIWPKLQDIAARQAFILGAEVQALETQFAPYCGSAHGIGVSSGTDALLLALMALDIGPNDGVITSTFTFFATGGTIARLQARPIFLDIDPNDFNLCPQAVKRYLTEHCVVRHGDVYAKDSGVKIKAIMPVHLYGQAANMPALMAIANEFNLKVIEDAAQAIGSEIDGKRVGGFGDIGCFSFFPTKNLGAFGDAGLCTASDSALAQRLKILRVHGGEPKYYHSMIGGNFRIDEIQAAVLNVKFEYLDQWSAARQRNAAWYREAFADHGLLDIVRLPIEKPNVRHIYNQFMIRIKERDALKKHLAEANIGTEIYYPVPLHLQECFASLGGKVGDCKEAEAAASEVLALPIYPELVQAQIHQVVEAIAHFYQQRK
jgi:dTDP-4-amino-4,6-dideoxygalactose transaminase